MPQDKPIGIDLGTTNSAMAWVDEAGRSAMIPNAEGEFITPSVVYFSESEVVVGKNARTAITAHPEMVAQWVKRDMGAPFYSHPIRGHYLPPEVIQACILRKLKADLVDALGPGAPACGTQTVITVPAYFDEMRRKATADAGEMAGLRVLDIVNEPTAAALAFGEALGYLAGHPLGSIGAPGTPGRQELNVLVYDLGGGTFDATLLRLAAGNVRTLATDGDVQLGGHDWDQRLVDYAAERFMQSHSHDPRQDPATLNRLYLDCMEAKHTLTARARAVIQVNYQGRFAEIAVSREQFEELSADLLERTSYTTRQLLAVAGLEWKDVQRILLVGGSTRMPMIARMLHGLSGIQPDRTVNPDEAVARGAALYAGHLLARRAGSPPSTFQVTNVNSHSLGVEGIDTDTLRKKNVVLIPRNTPLPARHTERFATKSEGQRSIVIKVLEGESSQPGECIAIGRTVVRDLPVGLPKAWPVEITFEYGTNGRLAVEAHVPGTHQQARLELLREAGLSGEGLNRWKQPVSEAGGFKTFESAAQDVLQSAQPAQEAGQSGIGAASWILAGKAGAGASGMPPMPPPAIGYPATSPATPEGPQRWASGPQPLTASPLPPAVLSGKGEGGHHVPMVGVRAAALSGTAEGKGPAAGEPLLPLNKRSEPAEKRTISGRVQRLIGYPIAIVLFGLIGYLMIAHIRPDLFPPLFGGAAAADEQKQDEK
jgi:molecular chaperone DnaK